MSGFATWTLGAHSRVLVRSTALPYVLDLEQGSVQVDVVPRPADRGMVEAFAVETGGTRVAVHGTLFTVTRDPDGVTVDVARGSVTVGPAGYRGLTTGHLLVAPCRAAFSLDGARQARWLPLPEPLEGPAVAAATDEALTHGGPGEAVARSSTPTDVPRPGEPSVSTPRTGNHSAAGPLAVAESVAPSEPGPAAPGEPAAAPEPEQPRPMTLAEAKRLITACLSTPTSSDGQSTVRVTISTQVTLRLGDDGRVVSVQFAPPLRPELQQRCAATVLGRTLTGAQHAATFPVVVSPD